jgi:4-hydroxy-2-oxoheptanedioate aldolase
MVNAVKEKMRRGEAVVGMMVWSGNVETAVLGAQLGFDFLWVEMEHSPVSHETLRQIVLATRGLPAVPFARPAVNELWTIKRLHPHAGGRTPPRRRLPLPAAGIAGLRVRPRRDPLAGPGGLP